MELSSKFLSYLNIFGILKLLICNLQWVVLVDSNCTVVLVLPFVLINDCDVTSETENFF